MPSQADLKKRRVKAGKQQIHQEVVVDRRDRRRRLLVGGFVGLLALAMIAPLAAGIFAVGGDDPVVIDDIPELPLDTTPPSLVDEAFAGAELTGETPCPATDGAQERVTSFETAPAGCLDPDASYTAAIDTITGTLEIELDTAAAPIASDLFVSLSRFGVYEGAPITLFEGIAVLGGFGTAGFEVEATEIPADGTYPVGSVVMLTEIGGGMNGQVVVITSEAGAEALAIDPNSPIIGTVTSGLDTLDALVELQRENQTALYRVNETSVTESTG